MSNLNDNELKGLPKDIDLLIQAASLVVSGNNKNVCMPRRMDHLKVVVEKVRKQYNEIMDRGEQHAIQTTFR